MEWAWGSADAPRAARATKVKVLFVNDGEKPSIECEGSDGAHYYASLEACSCPDFSINQRNGKAAACKHMVRLAVELGLLNKEGRTPRDQFLFDLQQRENLLAGYAWHYYVLNDPQISDEEYDKLKGEYMKWREQL